MPNVLCRMVISVSILLGSYWLPNASPDQNPGSPTTGQNL
ncbi:DndE family protein [Methylobacterium sp. J-070]|nr:DndE family protein [Methylobacterium sp. J-070]MCJ2053793.1 DndE family protein [Methylobacterium sp. J-070]